jgi:hypothetical protein
LSLFPVRRFRNSLHHCREFSARIPVSEISGQDCLMRPNTHGQIDIDQCRPGGNLLERSGVFIHVGL